MGDMFGGGGGGQTIDASSMGYSGLSQQKSDDDLVGTYRKAVAANRKDDKDPYAAMNAEMQNDQESRVRRLMGE